MIITKEIGNKIIERAKKDAESITHKYVGIVRDEIGCMVEDNNVVEGYWGDITPNCVKLLDTQVNIVQIVLDEMDKMNFELTEKNMGYYYEDVRDCMTDAFEKAIKEVK